MVVDILHFKSEGIPRNYLFGSKEKEKFIKIVRILIG